MNNLKKIKLVHETPNHFIMHDGNSHFHVAKKGLDQEMVQKIQGFADGGEADSMLSNLGDKISKAFEKKPKATAPTPEESLEEKNRKIREQAHKDFIGYADGGQVSFDDDFAQKFKKGSGFADGGQVGMGDVQQAEQQNAMRSAGPQISELPVQQVSPEEARYARAQAMMADKAPLTENDFTQPGENIPRDAGIVDFARYNAAHFDPTSEENLANIGMGGMGSINRYKDVPPEIVEMGQRVLKQMEETAKKPKKLYDVIDHNGNTLARGFGLDSAQAQAKEFHHKLGMDELQDKHYFDSLKGIQSPEPAIRVVDHQPDKIWNVVDQDNKVLRTGLDADTARAHIAALNNKLNIHELRSNHYQEGLRKVDALDKTDPNFLDNYRKLMDEHEALRPSIRLEKMPEEEIRKIKKEPRGFADGGQVSFDQDFADKFKKGSGFSSGGKVQHFDVGGTANGLPPDFDNRVEAEKQNLAVNAIAMPPQTIDNNNPLPMTASPLPVNNFQSQAETNVASQDLSQMSKAMQSEEAQKALTAQAVQDQNAKIMSDNMVRSQAGLPTLPLTPEPSMEQSQMSSVVPRENQVSFVPQHSTQAPQDPRSGTNLTGNFDKAMGQIQGGIRKSAELQSQAMAENAKNTQAYLDDQKQRAAHYEKERADIQAQNTELFNQVRDSKIDPNRIWNNSSTGQKISSALGLIFGGLGAGMSHQPNQAAEFLEKTIQNDIEAQKVDQSNKTNLYKLGLEKYRDSKSAEQFASLQASNVLAAQIQQTAQKIGSPQALAMAQQAIGELHLKYDPIRNDLALKQVALNYGGQQQGQQQPKSGVNTGKLNAFLNAGLYDEDTKKALIKEQGEYIKAKNYSDLADDLFNTQAKNANYTNRGMLQHLPTMRDSTKEYDAKVNSFLDKITKDLTGRVTPQSMENLKSSMPVAGDSPAVILAKRQSIKDIIKTGYEFPTLINKGLLNPNDPYVTSTGNMSSKFTQGAPVLKK